MLMWQIMSEKATTTNDRFYRALYSVMASDSVTNSTKGPMFLSLLFKVGRVGGGLETCIQDPGKQLVCTTQASTASECHNTKSDGADAYCSGIQPLCVPTWTECPLTFAAPLPPPHTPTHTHPSRLSAGHEG
jgi:hypothetical protein